MWFEEAVGGGAIATASQLDLEGQTLTMLVPALLVLFCFRGRAGTARGGGAVNTGEDCLPVAALLG